MEAGGALLTFGEADVALPVLDDVAREGGEWATHALNKLFAIEEIKVDGIKRIVISHTKLWDERGKDIFIRALNYQSDEVKAFAAVSLAEMGIIEKELIEEVAIGILNKNKWKGSSYRRANYHAIYALEIIKSKKAIPILEKITNNPDAGYIRGDAAGALNKIKTQK